MKKKETILEIFEKTYKKTSKQSIGIGITINDLREKEEAGKLTEEQRIALCNYERYRINELNAAKDEEAFHKKYEFLQVLANLRPYQDFLEEKENGL